MTYQQITPQWKIELQDSIKTDAKAQELITQLLINPVEMDGFTLQNGDLRKNGKYYVGDSNDLRAKLCASIHSNSEGGHSRVAITIKRAERTFYWPTMKSDITTYIKECEICQRNKPEHVQSPGLLQPISIPDQAWEVISMDFIEGLPKSKGKNVILVVVDKLTRYCHLIALSHPYNAHSVAQELLNSIVKLHGVTQEIISDIDTIFVSAFWKELFTALLPN